MIQKKYYKLVKVSYEDSEYLRMTNISDSPANFSVFGGGTQTRELEYSLDGVTWTSYDFTTSPTVEVAVGGNIYLRGNNSYGWNTNTYSNATLKMSGNHTIGGNICSLINKTSPESVTTLPDYCFYKLFAGSNEWLKNSTLISVGDMNFGNVTSIGNSSCYYMFQYCDSLTTGPNMSSVTSIGSSSCSCMFQYCSSLTTPPDLLSVTSVGNYGYSYMFNECTSLTTGLDMSGVNSVGNSGCQYIYEKCYKLSSATTPNISSWDTSKFNNWLSNAGTQATGTKTVYKPAALSIPTSSTSGVPSGWTTQNY